MYKQVATALVIVIVVMAGAAWYLHYSAKPAPQPTPSTSSGQAGTNPTANTGFTYLNASGDTIQVTLPYPNAVTGKYFSIIGQARGPWYFEASFPYKILDKDGNVLTQGPVQAQGDWMTNNFVPFKVDVTIPDSYTGPATIVLHNDNPSGDPTKGSSVSFPITVEF